MPARRSRTFLCVSRAILLPMTAITSRQVHKEDGTVAHAHGRSRLRNALLDRDSQHCHSHEDDTRGRHLGDAIRQHHGDEQKSRESQHRVAAKSVTRLEDQQNRSQ